MTEPLTIDCDLRQVSWRGEHVTLQRALVPALLRLVSRQNVLTRPEDLDGVLGGQYGSKLGKRQVAMQIRRALASLNAPARLETLHGDGWIFRSDVPVVLRVRGGA